MLDLEYIVDQLSDFYEPRDARLWVFSRQKLLDGATPAELIQQGHSNQGIGETLFLSLHTVKWHNQNIFDKLDVQRRTEAVARARELKLL